MKNYKNKEEFKKDLPYMDPIEVYKEVLSGKYLKRFPNGFWGGSVGCINIITVVKYLIEEDLKWSDEDILNKLDRAIFKNKKLDGMFSKHFDRSTYELVNTVYPDKFKPWEFGNVPRNYWNKETAKEATIWLVEEKLKWSDEDIKNKLGQYIFKNNKLGGMLFEVFKGSPYKVINNAYPNRFKPWEFNMVPVGYWNKETAKEATIWLIEEKLKWSDEDIKNKLTKQTFINNGLGGMVNIIFNSSPYETLNNAYPGKFKRSDFKYNYKEF